MTGTDEMRALQDRITAALIAEHYRRAGERIVATPEEHQAAFAKVVMGVIRSAPVLERDRPRDAAETNGTPPLWELDAGPCPFTKDEQWFDGWPELRDHADAYNDDLNVVIWWSWSPPDPTARNGDGDTLTLMMALPNRERVYPWSAKVSREEEPEIRAWLHRRLRTLIDWWQIPPPAPGGPSR